MIDTTPPVLIPSAPTVSRASGPAVMYKFHTPIFSADRGVSLRTDTRSRHKYIWSLESPPSRRDTNLQLHECEVETSARQG